MHELQYTYRVLLIAHEKCYRNKEKYDTFNDPIFINLIISITDQLDLKTGSPLFSMEAVDWLIKPEVGAALVRCARGLHLTVLFTGYYKLHSVKI